LYFPHIIRALRRLATPIPLCVVAAAALFVLSDLAFLKASFAVEHQHSGLAAAWFAAVADILAVGLAYSVLLRIVWRWPWLFCSLLLVGFAILPLPAYFADLFHIDLQLVMVGFFQSNPAEELSFIDAPLLARVAGNLSVGVAIAAVSFLRGPTLVGPSRGRRRAWLVGALALVIPIAHGVATHDRLRPLRTYLPFALGYYAYDTIAQSLEFSVRFRHKRDISAGPLAIEPQNRDLHVVVILGEAERAQSFSLDGYQRDTNPYTAKIPGLVNFTDAWACANLTYLAVPCLLTRATAENHTELYGRETSIISIYRRLGFFTSWLSTQSDWRFGVRGYQGAREITREAENRRFGWSGTTEELRALTDVKTDPKVLLPILDKAVRTRAATFTVLHSWGSHAPYARDYIGPDQRVFQPACDRPLEQCTPQEVVNAYDNTIVHTDQFIAAVIEAMRDKNTLLVYVSDHGESVYDDEHGRFVGRPGGTLTHGSSPERYRVLIAEGLRPEQRWIPMMWWASPRFLADPRNAARFARLVSKQHDKVSHDNLFHSLLDCAGISVAALDRDLSLCREGRVPEYDAFIRRPGAVPSDAVVRAAGSPGAPSPGVADPGLR
jgi:glucan phosphoethanolaminetransferase (alkaline phosphatase superfamily)